MKYCKKVTESHNVVNSYPTILRCASLILNEEGCTNSNNSFSINTKIVIDGDRLEGLIALKENRDKTKSMDLIFGTKNSSSSKFQLVELKLRCTNFYYLDKSSFLGKVLGTKTALSGVDFNTNYYIVFKDNVLEQAKRYLFRANPRLNNQFKAVSVEKLYSEFF